MLFGHSHIQFQRMIDGQQFINPGSVGQPRCGRRVACYGVIEDGAFRHCQVEYDPGPWLEALNGIRPLDGFPRFREWLKRALLGGYGIGERAPWTRYAREGVRVAHAASRRRPMPAGAPAHPAGPRSLPPPEPAPRSLPAVPR